MKTANIAQVAGYAVTVLMLTGCFQMNPQFGNNNSDSGDCLDSACEQKTTLPEYALQRPQVTEYLIVNVLKVPTTSPTVAYLQQKKFELGQADFAKGVAEDRKATAGRYKVLTEVYVDACAEGLMNPDVKAALFPAATKADGSAFDSLYKNLTGRLPSSDEVDVLTELSGQMSSQTKEAGVCAAVLSSLEILNET